MTFIHLLTAIAVSNLRGDSINSGSFNKLASVHVQRWTCISYIPANRESELYELEAQEESNKPKHKLVRAQP